MSKGEETKSRILQQAAEVFNQKVYAGTSMSDIMCVTGLQGRNLQPLLRQRRSIATGF